MWLSNSSIGRKVVMSVTFVESSRYDRGHFDYKFSVGDAYAIYPNIIASLISIINVVTTSYNNPGQTNQKYE